MKQKERKHQSLLSSEKKRADRHIISIHLVYTHIESDVYMLSDEQEKEKI